MEIGSRAGGNKEGGFCCCRVGMDVQHKLSQPRKHLPRPLAHFLDLSLTRSSCGDSPMIWIYVSKELRTMVSWPCNRSSSPTEVFHRRRVDMGVTYFE